MKKIVALAIAAFVLTTVSAMALPIPGIDNELNNACFVSQPNAETDWTYEGAMQFNGNGDPDGTREVILGRGHIAYALGPISGGNSLASEVIWGNQVRQTIDDTLSNGWNWNYNSKIWNFSGAYYTANGGAVRFRLGWWNRLDGTKPAPGDAPDNYTDYYYLNATNGQWSTFSVDGAWANQQPRWIRVIVELSTGWSGSAAAIDDTSFTSKCVPEPSSLAAMASGLLGFAGLLWRKRS